MGYTKQKSRQEKAVACQNSNYSALTVRIWVPPMWSPKGSPKRHKAD